MWWAELAMTMTGASNFPVVVESQVSKTISFQEITLKFQDSNGWCEGWSGAGRSLRMGEEKLLRL